MKRLYFLSAAGAAALAGCGKHVLPGMTPTSTAQRPVAASSFKLVPEIPDPIPTGVLANPIVGEARRFSGNAAPANWMFMQGQKVAIADYPQLFSVLGHAPGDKETKTFTLPNVSYGVIVAAKGTVPASPRALARTRNMSYQASLGPGARLPMPKVANTPSPATLEARRLMASAIRPRSASPVEVSAEVSGALDRTRATAHDSAVQAIGARSLEVLDGAVAAAVDGRMTVYQAVMQVAQRLTGSEASAVLAVNDRMRQSFSNVNSVSHQDPQREAATFLVTEAITPEQAAVIAQRE